LREAEFRGLMTVQRRFKKHRKSLDASIDEAALTLIRNQTLCKSNPKVRPMLAIPTDDQK